MISNMKTFISERILAKSVEYMEYAEKTKRKTKDNLIFTHILQQESVIGFSLAFNPPFRQVALLFYSCLITFLQRKASLLSLPMNVQQTQAQV